MSRGAGFTHASFSGVTTEEVTDRRMIGVGRYVAQEDPGRLADLLLEALADGETRNELRRITP